MRKDLGSKTYLFPMPVLIIGTYDDQGLPNAMNAAWGTIRDYGIVEINLGPHKTTDNILLKKAFSIAFATKEYVKEADYVGIVSQNEVKNKLEIANFHTTKSKFVDAPIIEEFPVSLECSLIKMDEDGVVLGQIVNVNATEEVLDEKGNIDVTKMHLIAYEPAGHRYLELTNVVGHAFKDGLQLKK